jgi:hypothetical protein
MRYIITEQQYKLLTEEEEQKILKLPGIEYFGSWDTLQKFLEKRGNPLYSIDGNLDLKGTGIKSLGNLVSVSGNLDLWETDIEDIGKLQSVGGTLNLSNTSVKSLGNLKSVGNIEKNHGDLHLFLSSVENLGSLESVGGDLVLFRSKIKSIGNLNYVGGFLNMEKTPLAKTHTKEKIRKQVYVGNNIYTDLPR